MKNKSSFIFKGLLVISLMFTTAVQAQRGSASPSRGRARYSGAGSYTSNTITQNQNYIATTNTAGTGVGGDPLSGQMGSQCKLLVAEALKSYCYSNECSEASNAFIIAKALSFSQTIVNQDRNVFDSPSTPIESSVAQQVGAYAGTGLPQACQPYLAQIVEELLPAYYDIVTDQCRDQYRTGIDHYMANNEGGFLMGGTGDKRTIRNFELLEFFKANHTNTYEMSLYQDETSENYYFSEYCMEQMADSVKLSLIDLYIPDLYTYQRNMCRRSYEHAIQKYCVFQGPGCRGEIDYMQVIMDQGFLTEVDNQNTQINCGTELAQDVREALVEEVVRKQNICAREMGAYNAEKDMCMFNIALIDAKNKEIERKKYYEGEVVHCTEKDFIDPYSKEGRKRVGKGYLASQGGFNLAAGAVGGLLGAMAGSGVGSKVAKSTRVRKALIANGVDPQDVSILKNRVRCPSGKTISEAAASMVVEGRFTQGQAEDVLEELCLVADK